MRKSIRLILLLACPSVGFPDQAAGPVVFAPARPLFAPLIADPREPCVRLVPYLDERGFELDLGGTLDLLRWRSAPDMEWGAGIYAGLWTLSDGPDLSTFWVDDWFTGFYVSETTGAWSFRLEYQDQKSDPGDALPKPPDPFYPPSPGYPKASRYFFTRDDQNLTVSFRPGPGWRLYAGAGCKTWWDDFDPTESQVFVFSGLETSTGSFSFLGNCRAYGAYHFKYQDQAGGTYNHSVQLGLRWDSVGGQGGGFRLALMADAGRSEFGEFYEADDRHLSVGLFYEP